MKRAVATLRGLAAREKKSSGHVSGETGHGGTTGSLGQAGVYGKTEMMSQPSQSGASQSGTAQSRASQSGGSQAGSHSRPAQGKPLQERLAQRQSRLHISEIVEQEPISEYDSVGLELQAHRTRKGHDLDMAGRVLRIKPTHLKAIEDDHFEVLPGKTYAVGFVRAYAEYLGLNPEDCVRRFKLEYAAVMEVPSEDAAKTKKSGLMFPDLREDVQLPLGSIIILGSLVVMAVWGGWYLSTSAERAFSNAESETVAITEEGLPTPEEAQAILEGTAEPVAEDQAVVDETGTVVPPTDAVEEASTAETADANAATEPAVEDAAPLSAEPLAAVNPTAGTHREPQVFGLQNHDARVIIRARGNAWVRVEDHTGAVTFEETMQRGDSFRVPNRNGLIMATRNAGAVELMVDGTSIGPAGAVGQALLSQSLDANTLADNAPQQP